MKILVMNGPNLQLLGRRKAEFYGTRTLPEIEVMLQAVAAELGVEMEFMQSNHEGVLVDRVAEAITGGVDGIVINPAAYTHTSIALRDALEAARIPAVEVHLSNVASRDEFRKVSLTAPMCIGQISGLGADGYEWAMRALVRYLKQKKTS
jgi:3-dehydroquinate dehydratase-2